MDRCLCKIYRNSLAQKFTKMKNLFYLFTFLLMTTLLFSNFQCGHDENDDWGWDCDIEAKEASIAVSVLPEQATYTLEDTIWLEMQYDVGQLFDNDTLEFEEGEGYLHMHFFNLVEPPYIVTLPLVVARGYEDFEFISAEGSVNQDWISEGYRRDTQGSIVFNCQQGICKFKVGLRAKNSGNYCLVLQRAGASVVDNEPCQPGVNFWENHFDVTSHNREIFQELGVTGSVRVLTPYSSDDFVSVAENDAAYVFKVEE